MIQDPLANMTDDYGRNIGPYFVPLVDGIIASKGKNGLDIPFVIFIVIMHH
jgi:hypothetical protein